MTSTVRLILVLSILLMAGPIYAGDAPQPAPALTPGAVVSAQLGALRGNNPANNRGIATAFGFATPGNQQAVGGLQAFTVMIYDSYPDMLIHDRAVVSVIQRRENVAAVRAVLHLPTGERSAYVFVLRRIDTPDCQACWRTAGVIPLSAPPEPLRSI